MIKINTTGSFCMDSENNYWSYGTQLTKNFNGFRIVNITRYSNTTSKHQAKVNRTSKDILLDIGHYGYIRPEEDLQANLKLEQDRLITLNNQRNSKHKQTRINNCIKQIELIQTVLKGV